jgi:hypothetical protein
MSIVAPWTAPALLRGFFIRHCEPVGRGNPVVTSPRLDCRATLAMTVI